MTVQQTVEQLQVIKIFCLERHPTAVVCDKSELTVPYCMQYSVGRVLSFFSSRRNWDSQPLTRSRVCPPPPRFSGGRGTLLAREGLGESQFRRGDIHCGTIYIYMYFVVCRMKVSRRVWTCPTLSSPTAVRQEITAPQTETAALCVLHLLYCMYCTRTNDRIEYARTFGRMDICSREKNK